MPVHLMPQPPQLRMSFASLTHTSSQHFVPGLQPAGHPFPPLLDPAVLEPVALPDTPVLVLLDALAVEVAELEPAVAPPPAPGPMAVPVDEVVVAAPAPVALVALEPPDPLAPPFPTTTFPLPHAPRRRAAIPNTKLFMG